MGREVRRHVPDGDQPERAEGEGAQRLTLGHLTRGSEIRFVLRNGRNYGCGAGSARIREGASSEHRLCVVASRQVGKAHVRNRVRRTVREIVRREIRHDAAPIDLVFRAKPAAEAMGFWEIHRAVTDILRRAGLRSEPDPARWG
jgi:ribonuclease P protein component